MKNYDAVLKSLLMGPARVIMKTLGGCEAGVKEWLPGELSSVQNRRMDLLCRCTDRRLIHIELQSTNDPTMPLRMADYALATLRALQEFPEQIVLYVGNDPLCMPDRWTSPNGRMRFTYRLIDIRELDANALSASPDLSDTILAVLARGGDTRESTHRILQQTRRTIWNGRKRIGWSSS